MRTWNDYKDHVKNVDPVAGKDVEEAEEMATIILAMIEQRQALGLSQRGELAHRCGMPQSSIARIESCAAMPKLGTILSVL